MILELILAIENPEQKAAVEYIYDKLYRLMYQNAFNILQNHHDAEDAVMETFVRIVNNAHKFVLEEKTAIISLVTIYTRNVAKTYYVQRKKTAAVSMTICLDDDSNDSQQFEIPDPDSNPERIVIKNETIQMVADAINKLGDEQRIVIMLRYHHKQSYAEIARQLNINEPAARARVFRGKEKLRQMLGDEMYERVGF